MLRCGLLAPLIVGLTLAIAPAQKAPHNANKQVSSSVYEDDAVRIAIPAGWARASGPQPSLHASYVLGVGLSDIAPIQLQGTLLLQKGNYTLGIGYRTGHASGIIGGRIIEIFEIPWDINGDDWGCLGILTRIPQPASRSLLFDNLLLNTDDEHVRSTCGIPKNLGGSTLYTGDRQRWYGGYFTAVDGSYFFDENQPDQDCQSKAYSLTTTAKTPNQLPFANDKHLEQVIKEATDIVGSIQYKRCAPILTSPINLPASDSGD